MTPNESKNDRDQRVDKLWETLGARKEGLIDLNGLKRGLKKIDHPLKNADDMLRSILVAVDTNGDGHIDFSEFRAFVDHTESGLWKLFQSIDRNNNGKIDKADLKAAFSKSGVTVSSVKLNEFFWDVDKNKDGVITYEEWRDFLLFMPSHSSPDLRAILSYYTATGNLNPEGDVNINDLQGLGYFVAGGIAGVVSRTATAPLDRLKVYLIAQTGVKSTAVRAAKEGAPLQAAGSASKTLVDAMKELWRAGGIRSLFAGNGLNVAKVMPESAIKFGAYESAKRAFARLEGHNDPKKLMPVSQFLSGGCGGMVAQCFVYPLDTLKFRMQCETVEGGPKGNRLIAATARKVISKNGILGFFRGLPLGLVGMFPYAAIDLTTFEYLKRGLVARKARLNHCHEDDVPLNNFMTGAIGAFSGAFGASVVYPLNVLRTRLQAQGTILHPVTYDSIGDVARKTIQTEGPRGLYKGITPNLLKVVPAVSISYVVYENSKRFLGLK
ncbi:uncharacterized protein ASPGLDRAFT_42167 [Aspergillus glaucus CBS 516.65]|uniref:Mitochondrial thiamine pyrophosphate carrier 1 n=1 Tax=Aspergillus glaucus CBS 516.65 TaxID=1160497 RepID=A0A1L9VXI2_ASPGL|nr:hypothetical protein ASPGLDRAFT_42167 [Aspergillus glaucus CBS 516.65]OJJ88587.1 hypothetical protein ASPGLDRAFT_42167 [Aspergillus glaucus CBS 516.65]